MLKPNIQLFAEPATDGDPTPAPQPTTQQSTAGGKVFSEEYVQSLRNESAGYRTQRNTYEKALRGVLGIKDDEELGDLNTRISDFNQKRAAALEAANQRVINAQLRTLEGYDAKLLAKVIDLSEVKVAEDGTVTGLKEAAEKAAQEYPAVCVNPPPVSRKTPGANTRTGKDKANEALRSLFGR